MIDIHSHILPGIDDGPAAMSEAVAMCRMAGDSGCEVLVATPHQFHPNWQNAEPEALNSLRDELQEKVGDAPRILLGAEIRVGANLLSDLSDCPSSGALSLANSRYLLIELDRDGIGPDPEEVVHELVVSGWQPIVAHPEFISSLAQNFQLMESLHEQGALFQVTAASVTGDLGRRPQRDVTAMIDAGLVAFVASDAHGTKWRPPGLQKAYTMVRSRWGVQVARRLTVTNPLAVVENRPLISADVSEVISVDELAETSNNSLESSRPELGPRLVYKV